MDIYWILNFNSLLIEWTYVYCSPPAQNAFNWIFPVALDTLLFANYTWGKKSYVAYPSQTNLSPAFEWFNGTSINVFMWNAQSFAYIGDGFILAIGY